MFLLLGAEDCTAVNASLVEVGYLFKTPRLEDNHASEIIITKERLGSVLALLCLIDPPLPNDNDYWDNKNDIVKWSKLAPIPGDVDSVRYWSDDRSKTAVSFSNITLDTLGTYSCSYAGLSQTIDVLGKEECLELIYYMFCLEISKN